MLTAVTGINNAVGALTMALNGGTIDGKGSFPGLTSAKKELSEGMQTIGAEGQESLKADANLQTKLQALKEKYKITDEEYQALLNDLSASKVGTQKTLQTVGQDGSLMKAETGVTFAESMVNGVLNGSGDGTPGLKGAADQLKAGVDSLAQGLSDATSETGELSVGLNKLVTGSSKLAAGEAQLSSGASELAAGMNELYSKSGLLISGIGQLDAGSKKLNDGMSQFYKEGIGKIVSLYNDKLKGTVNNAESLVAAGKAYNTFTQVPDGMDGTVKFIYRTKVAD